MMRVLVLTIFLSGCNACVTPIVGEPPGPSKAACEAGGGEMKPSQGGGWICEKPK